MFQDEAHQSSNDSATRGNPPIIDSREIPSSETDALPPLFLEGVEKLVEERLALEMIHSESTRRLLLLEEPDETSGELTKALHETIDSASEYAEATLDLALVLAKGPATPESDSLLIELISDLNPGPSSKLIIETLLKNGRIEGAVETQLRSIESRWTNSYGTSTQYAQDLSQLHSSLYPEKPLFHSLSKALKSFFHNRDS